MNFALKEIYEYTISDPFLADSEVHLGRLVWQDQTLLGYGLGVEAGAGCGEELVLVGNVVSSVSTWLWPVD